MNGNGILYIAIIAPKNSLLIPHIQAVEQATQNAITSIGTFIHRHDLNRRHSITPEVVVIDCVNTQKLHMWLQEIHHQWATAEIILITPDPRIYITMIPHGATTLLEINDPVSRFSETIYRTSALRLRLSPSIAALILTDLVSQAPTTLLEPEEIAILSDIAQGISNDDIVQQRHLHDNEATERHMYNLVKKLYRLKHPQSRPHVP